MKLTIVPEDNIVVVDGIAATVNVDSASDIHAIQWDSGEKKGTIEYKSDKSNKSIGADDIAPFLSLVTDHAVEKARIEKLINDSKAADDAFILKFEVFEKLATTKRLRAYEGEMPVGDQLDEILKYIDGRGDASSTMLEIIAKSKEIKGRFPKEGE